MELRKQYNVVIADDHPIVYKGLKDILEKDNEINVLACVGNGLHAYNVCRETSVDVVILDINMPECNGIEAIKLIQALTVQPKILIFTSFTDEETIQEILSYRISGIIQKDDPPEIIINSVKNAVIGAYSYSECIQKIITKSNLIISDKGNALFADLSQNEYKVLELIAEGLENKEIASMVLISEGSVKAIVSNLLIKYNVRNRVHLASFAARNGLGWNL